MPAASQNKLEKMSFEDLLKLQESVQSQINERADLLKVRNKVIRAVSGLPEVKTICQENGLKMKFLFNPPKEILASENDLEAKNISPSTKKRTRVYKPVPPKYRLPSGETWTGRGVKPKVFAIYVEQGGNLEDLRILT